MSPAPADTGLALPAASLLQLTATLLLVVALIFGITWVVKRFSLVTPRRSRAMSVIDELALSPRERVVLVQVGGSQVLLGVGANGLTALAPLAAPIDLPPAANAPGFAERLRDLMRRPGADA